MCFPLKTSKTSRICTRYYGNFMLPENEKWQRPQIYHDIFVDLMTIVSTEMDGKTYL